MRKCKTIVLLFACVSFIATLVPVAKADLGNRDTYLTFSQPVEIPGRVLPPGKYEFRLVPANSAEIVSIYDSNGKLIEAVLAEPIYRTKVDDRTIVTFAKRGTGAPEAIDSWFYPDTLDGVHFLYPHHKKSE